METAVAIINTAIAVRLQRNRIHCCSVWHL